MRKLRNIAGACCLAAASITATGAVAAPASEIKIGFIASLTGPFAMFGEEMVNALKLGLEQTGGKLGGIPAKLLIEDDQLKPPVTVQVARKFIDQDQVDVVLGPLSSNLQTAVVPLVTKQAMMIAPAGASSLFAGAQCNENFFAVGWSTDTNFEAAGVYLREKDAKRVYAIAINIQAGGDAINGFKREYKTPLVGETYVKLDQTDFSAEISQIRAANPEALVFFIPGGNGIAFVKQFAQAGLGDKVTLYSANFQMDELTYPALGDAVLGSMVTGNWSSALDNPANKKFVAAFREKFKRNPSPTAAMTYDTVLMLDAAVKEAKGEVKDLDKLRAAIRHVKYDSVRGPVSVNQNHTPIQHFYMNKLVKSPSGEITSQLVGTVLKDRPDGNAPKCQMSWK